jgi:hypothetical protein
MHLQRRLEMKGIIFDTDIRGGGGELLKLTNHNHYMAISKQPISMTKYEDRVTYFCMTLIQIFMHTFLLVQGVYKHMHMHTCTFKHTQVFEERL